MLVLKKTKYFLQYLDYLADYNTSKVFTNEELELGNLLNLLTFWKKSYVVTPSDYDVLVELRSTLANIITKLRKFQIKLEESTLALFKEVGRLCSKYLFVIEEDREKEEEKKESRDDFEGEYRVEETSNCHGHVIFGEAMNYEKVREQLFNINAQKRRLLHVLEEHHYIVEAIREEFPSPTIRSDLDKGLKSFIDHYQYLNSKLDELSAHYNGMIKQWFS